MTHLKSFMTLTYKDGEVDKYTFQTIDPASVTNERIVYKGDQSLLDKIKRSVRIIGE